MVLDEKYVATSYINQEWNLGIKKYSSYSDMMLLITKVLSNKTASLLPRRLHSSAYVTMVTRCKMLACAHEYSSKQV